MSQQCTEALNCLVAKALPAKYQITAHRPCMHDIQLKQVKACREELVREQYHITEPFVLPVCSYSGCCIHRLSLNTAWHSQSLLEACQRNSRRKQSLISYAAKSQLRSMFSKPRFSTQLDVYSSGFVHRLSKSYAPVPSQNVANETQLLLFVRQVHMLRLSFLAVFHNCCHSSSCQLAISLVPRHSPQKLGEERAW